MTLRFAAAAFALLLAMPLATAQTPPTPAPAAKPALAAPAASVTATKDGKPKAGEVRKACREEGRGKGLKGQALRASVDECFAKQRPDLVKNKACRTDADAKKLAGKERRDFMRTCRAA